MSKTRLLLGTTLIGAGVAASLFAVRMAVGDRASAQAAVLETTTRQAAASAAADRRALEARVQEATEIGPLLAALKARVDGRTLVDLFDNEDWWRGYRADMTAARVVVGEAPLAARGLDLAGRDLEVVKAARRQRVASAIVTVGNQTLVLGAARLSVLPESEPVLVLARAATPVPVLRAGTPATPVRPLPWAVAGAMAVTGLGLLVSGRRSRAGGAAVAGEIPHVPTSRFGTGVRPRAATQPLATAMVTPPARGRMSDVGAVRIAGSSAGSPAPTITVATPPPPAPAAAAPSAPMALTPSAANPAPFGRYRLIDRLGEGGMSELFIAEAAGVEGFTRNFVLKRLRPELARDKEAVAQFIDEARLQASLVHSNIVPVFDFGMVSGEYFMTQEYIVGRDLSRLMTRHYEQGGAGLPPALAYYVAHETLQALAYAHDKRDKEGQPMGIVHRDISAGNVMVSLIGEVKLSDFGIVKANRRVSRTQVGMVKGNANFMSPEQARGQQVDARSDLYSLGHVLFYCLTGELLYSGDNDLDVLYRAATGLTGEDWIRIGSLPDPAPQILERALANEPAERFQTALEFADVLAAHTGGGKLGMAKLIQTLFGEDLQRQAS